MKLTLQKDEVDMLVEILNGTKELCEEMLRDPEHYKKDLPQAKWDLLHVNRLLKVLTKTGRV